MLFDIAVISVLAEKQIYHLAASDVFTRLAAVAEDVGVGAAGLFEGVGGDWKVMELAFVTDDPCQFAVGSLVPAWAALNPRDCRIDREKRLPFRISLLEDHGRKLLLFSG